MLSGKIEYQPASKASNKFSGYVKLKKDPKAEPLTEENFIPRGSILKNTDWFEIFVKIINITRLFGICVYTGNDTRIMLGSKPSVNKNSYFEKLSKKFFVVGFFIIIIMSIVIELYCLIDDLF